MTPERYHPIYKWTDYKRALQRDENKRRHTTAAIWGAIVAVSCAAAIIYLVR
jgi:DNA-binding MltR family transcriptional regulator